MNSVSIPMSKHRAVLTRAMRSANTATVALMLVSISVGGLTGYAFGRSDRTDDDIIAPAINQESVAPTRLPDAPLGNVVDVAKSNQFLTNAVAALALTGLDQTILIDGPYTVLLPTNDAMAKASNNNVASILDEAYKTQLTAALRNLIVPGVYTTAELKALAVNQSTITNLSGTRLQIKIQDTQLTLVTEQGVPITFADSDFVASNGIIHGVNNIPIAK